MTISRTNPIIFPNTMPPSPAWAHIPPRRVDIPEFKPKKAGKDTAHVIFVLDDSASMQSCRDSTIKGFNEFLQGQKDSKVKTYVSLFKFDGSATHCVFDHVDAAIVEPLNNTTYNPWGSTNLYDGIGNAMNEVNRRLKLVKKANRDSVTIVILTDGQENSSQFYGSADIKAMVEKAEGKNWSFMFLGANIDAFDAGGALGFGHHNTLQYNTSKMGDTMRVASRMTSDMSAAKATGMATMDAYVATTFTDTEREEAN